MMERMLVGCVHGLLSLVMSGIESEATKGKSERGVICRVDESPGTRI